MSGSPNPFEALIARLAAEPELGQLAQPGAVVLVWDGAGERLLWASPDAMGVKDAFTDPAGRVTRDFRARDRIRLLAGGLAPREGIRVERLRLDPARPWLPVACVCRLASLESGETVLVTALVGPVPKMATRPRPAQAQEVSVGPA